MMNQTEKHLDLLNNNPSLVILKKEFGKEKSWTTVDAKTAFKNILKFYSWMEDGDSLSEEEFLREFTSCFEVNMSWIQTEEFTYKFLNIDVLQKISDENNQSLTTKVELKAGSTIEDVMKLF